MRVAYYSPLPPEPSGIADYSAVLLSALRGRVDVRVASRGRRPPRADVACYHIGNAPEAHGWILHVAQRRPGLVVLHERTLHHLVAGMTLANGRGDQYIEALERDAGVPGRLLGYGVVTGRVPSPWESAPDLLPLTREVFAPAKDHGLVVHSQQLADWVRAAGFTGPVHRIPHFAWPAPEVRPEAIDGAPVIGTFGHLDPWRRLPQILAAFAELRAVHPRARLLLVGEEAKGVELGLEVERLRLGDSVIRTGRVSEERLWALYAASDVCVTLRSPTMGAVSGSAMRALSLGRPLVVTAAGAFDELPDDVVVKVASGEGEVAALAETFIRLVDDPEARARLTEAAVEHVQRHHALDRVADAYVAAFEVAAGGRAVDDALVRAVSRAAADVRLDDASSLGVALREVGVGP